MQFGQDKTLGVVYQTTMDRPDAALALAMLHGYEGRRETRIAAISISDSGLGAAAFCDAVARFYAGQGPLPNTNRLLPIGLVADGPLPPDSPMVTAVLDRKNDKGEPEYPRGIRRVSDTSEVRAQIRNALTGLVNGTAVIVLSAPATQLARVLDLPGTRELFAAKVKTLVLSDPAGLKQDVTAARRVLADWPTPVVLMDKTIGSRIPYPASSIEADFAWTSAHPVADAVRVFKMDAPSWDLVAMQYAIHSDSTMWRLSGPGTIRVSDSGVFGFDSNAAGKHRLVSAAENQNEAILKAFVEIVSAKPVPRPQRRPK
jgi:hypothetical protein